jgi:hypothetical protein
MGGCSRKSCYLIHNYRREPRKPAIQLLNSLGWWYVTEIYGVNVHHQRPIRFNCHTTHFTFKIVVDNIYFPVLRETNYRYRVSSINHYHVVWKGAERPLYLCDSPCTDSSKRSDSVGFKP